VESSLQRLTDLMTSEYLALAFYSSQRLPLTIEDCECPCGRDPTTFHPLALKPLTNAAVTGTRAYAERRVKRTYIFSSSASAHVFLPSLRSGR
jgi:hypothetical protein